MKSWKVNKHKYLKKELRTNNYKHLGAQETGYLNFFRLLNVFLDLLKGL